MGQIVKVANGLSCCNFKYRRGTWSIRSITIYPPYTFTRISQTTRGSSNYELLSLSYIDPQLKVPNYFSSNKKAIIIILPIVCFRACLVKTWWSTLYTQTRPHPNIVSSYPIGTAPLPSLSMSGVCLCCPDWYTCTWVVQVSMFTVAGLWFTFTMVELFKRKAHCRKGTQVTILTGAAWTDISRRATVSDNLLGPKWLIGPSPPTEHSDWVCFHNPGKKERKKYSCGWHERDNTYNQVFNCMYTPM